jgi:hypothetical protein
LARAAGSLRRRYVGLLRQQLAAATPRTPKTFCPVSRQSCRSRRATSAHYVGKPWRYPSDAYRWCSRPTSWNITRGYSLCKAPLKKAAWPMRFEGRLNSTPIVSWRWGGRQILREWFLTTACHLAVRRGVPWPRVCSPHWCSVFLRDCEEAIFSPPQTEHACGSYPGRS